MLRLALAFVLMPAVCLAQAANYPGGKRPTLDEVRREMGIPSRGDVRGQLDNVGYASSADEMAKIWTRAAAPPEPPSLGNQVAPGVLGLLGPHDDYVYSARVDRRLWPLVTAKTVVVIGVFHRYRKFGAHDQLVFDDYRAWRAPDGDVTISPLRDALVAALPADARVQDDAAHDSEHSVESIVYWLKHQRADLELVPILVPAMNFPRLQTLANELAHALATQMQKRHLALGKDVAIVISTDGTHYGSDFQYTPFGAGGVDAYVKAVADDRALLTGPLAGPLAVDKAQAFFARVVDPAHPDAYRMPWCGRFSVPLGLLTLAETAKALGLSTPLGVPLMLGSSLDTAALGEGLHVAATAPANFYHFVTQPAVAFVAH